MTSDNTRWLLRDCALLRQRLRAEERRAAPLMAWLDAMERRAS